MSLNFYIYNRNCFISIFLLQVLLDGAPLSGWSQVELTSFQATVVTLSPGDHQLVTQENMARMAAHLMGGASGSHAFGYSYPVGVCLGVLGDVSIVHIL